MLTSPLSVVQFVPTHLFLVSVGHKSTWVLRTSFEQTRKLSVQLAAFSVPPRLGSTVHGYLSPWSLVHMRIPKLTCLRLLTQLMSLALAFARANAGRSMLAK